MGAGARFAAERDRWPEHWRVADLDLEEDFLLALLEPAEELRAVIPGMRTTPADGEEQVLVGVTDRRVVVVGRRKRSDREPLRVIDVTHGIPATAVLQGAHVLASTLPYMPVGVHLAVVDPGVGGVRRPVALADRDGHLFVGPDNGLLLPAAERAGIADVRELANPAYALDSISRTFHGRDLFAPAAAHLANGVPLTELGPPLHPDALVRLDLPRPAFYEDRIDATMLYVDSFGNIALNLTRDDAEHAGVVPGSRVELELAGERYYAVMARTFADARPGDVILYEDSYRNMSVAINRGNAASMLHAGQGQPLRIRVLGPAAAMR